jgi:threonine dehydrogenase-like Zn-dependent dehydrogenase
MAEYMRFPVDALNHRVPQTLKPEQAVYIEPLACAIHAVQRAEVELGDAVVVAGCGALGLGMIAAARLKSPKCLIALDLQESRLEVARRCGADIVLNPAKVDVTDEVLKLTGGYGCDVYIEATGHPLGVEQGLHMIRKLGTFVEFSLMREPVTVDWTIIGDMKELNIHGAHLGPYCYPLAIDMLVRNQIPVDAIVTHQMPLEAYMDGISMVHSGQECIKVMLIP